MKRAGPWPPEPLGPSMDLHRPAHLLPGVASGKAGALGPHCPRRLLQTPIAYLSSAGHQAGDRWAFTAPVGPGQGRKGWLTTCSVAVSRMGRRLVSGSGLGPRGPLRRALAREATAPELQEPAPRPHAPASPLPTRLLPQPPTARCSFLWQPGNAAHRRPLWVDGRGRPLSAPHRGDPGAGAPLVNFRYPHGFAGPTPPLPASLQGM